MKQFRLSRTAVLLAAIGFAALPELTNFAPNIAFAQEALRPEVGKIVQAASTLYKERKYKEALNKIHEADGIGGKNANESLTVERMRLAIASAAGDNDSIIRSAEVVLASNKLASKDQLQLIQVLANAYYKAANYTKASQYYSRYFAEGGTDKSLRQYMIQAMAQGGDGGRALKEVLADIAADEKAGRTPSQSNLEFYASSALRQKDTAGYNRALEKLVIFYGKKEYWANLLAGVQQKPGFNQRLSLDVYRLKLAVGQLTRTQDFMEASQLALQAGFPSEGIKLIDAGYKAGALGVGAEAPRHKRLRDLADTKLAESKKNAPALELEEKKARDGNGSVDLGYHYVASGQFDKGIDLIEQGISKGGLKYPEDAKLHLGIAYLQAGKKPNAIRVLKTVQGTDGTADLARYWVIYANQATK